MRFGLIANIKRPGAAQAIEAFIDWSRKRNIEIILSDELRDLPDHTFQFASRDKLASLVDILVSMGGDGTLLAAAREAGPPGTSVLGINLGSLGFLTPTQPTEMIPALDAVLGGDYAIEERMALKASIKGKSKLANRYALNDVVIDNGPIARLIDIHLWADGEEVTTYRADGLVLATPTGSTAYNLATGGPIMYPSMQAIIASPISSFSLTTRPMIFPADVKLELQIGSKHEVAGLTLDGQVMAPLMNDDRVVVTRADFSLKLIKFPDDSFFKVLKRKLHWGISPHDDRGVGPGDSSL